MDNDDTTTRDTRRRSGDWILCTVRSYLCPRQEDRTIIIILRVPLIGYDAHVQNSACFKGGDRVQEERERIKKINFLLGNPHSSENISSHSISMTTTLGLQSCPPCVDSGGGIKYARGHDVRFGWLSGRYWPAHTPSIVGSPPPLLLLCFSANCMVY